MDLVNPNIMSPHCWDVHRPWRAHVLAVLLRCATPWTAQHAFIANFKYSAKHACGSRRGHKKMINRTWSSETESYNRGRLFTGYCATFRACFVPHVYIKLLVYWLGLWIWRWSIFLINLFYANFEPPSLIQLSHSLLGGIKSSQAEVLWSCTFG